MIRLDAVIVERRVYLNGKSKNGVYVMCNLSQGIAERAAEEATLTTTEKIIKQMSENKFTPEQIALATGKTIKEIEDILQQG